MGDTGQLGQRWAKFAREKQEGRRGEGDEEARKGINQHEDEADDLRKDELRVQALVYPLDIIKARRQVITRVLTRWYYDKGSGTPPAQSAGGEDPPKTLAKLLEVSDGDLRELDEALGRALKSFRKRVGASKHDAAWAAIATQEKGGAARADEGPGAGKEGGGKDQGEWSPDPMSSAENDAIRAKFAACTPIHDRLSARQKARAGLTQAKIETKADTETEAGAGTKTNVEAFGERSTRQVDATFHKIPRSPILPDNCWLLWARAKLGDIHFEAGEKAEGGPVASYLKTWQDLRKNVGEILGFVEGTINHATFETLAGVAEKDPLIKAAKEAEEEQREARGPAETPVGAADIHRLGKEVRRTGMRGRVRNAHRHNP